MGGKIHENPMYCCHFVPSESNHAIIQNGYHSISKVYRDWSKPITINFKATHTQTHTHTHIYIYIEHQTWGFVHQDFVIYIYIYTKREIYIYIYWIFVYNGTSKRERERDIYIYKYVYGFGGTPGIPTLRWHTPGLPSDWEAIQLSKKVVDMPSYGSKLVCHHRVTPYRYFIIFENYNTL